MVALVIFCAGLLSHEGADSSMPCKIFSSILVFHPLVGCSSSTETSKTLSRHCQVLPEGEGQSLPQLNTTGLT